jgi:hypothetical protein
VRLGHEILARCTQGGIESPKVGHVCFPDDGMALIGRPLPEEREGLMVVPVGPEGMVFLMRDADEAGCKDREGVLSQLFRRVYVKMISLGEDGWQLDSLGKDGVTRMIRRI